MRKPGSDNLTAALITLGCKLNQFETEQMREQLEAMGFRIVPWQEKADLYIVNSCTVTSKADRDTRRLARQAKRNNPQAFVIVAGCYADTGADQLRQIEEIDLLLPNRDKMRLGEILHQLGLSDRPVTLPAYAGEGPLIRRFSGHTRAFVKVQQGCDAACAYCIIPRARGPSRSVPPEEVVRQVRALAAAGHAEIVLIGTHLGRYGLDLDPPTTLSELCRKLCEIEEVGRLRLSSIEPREIDDELVALLSDGGQALAGDARRLAGQGKLCRHLHIPLQSGTDEILRAMRRPYDTAFYAELIHRLVREIRGICIGADVMVGFPGESEELFEETVQFIEQLPLSYLHVFTYSPRPGTPAAEMDGQVPPEERKRRNHVLRRIAARKWAEFVASQVGKIVEVIPEREKNGKLESIADNYLRVRHEGSSELIGRIVRVQITRTEGELAFGTLVAEENA